MKLDLLLAPWLDIVDDTEITHLTNDSRKAGAGDLFIAFKGHNADGRLYIADAVAQGVSAVLYDEYNFPGQIVTHQTIPLVPCANLRAIYADLAARFYQNPSAKLTVTGVTGTNGKTTIACLLAHAQQLLGKNSAYIGTLGFGVPGKFAPLVNTTPDALLLQKIMAELLNNEVTELALEVSSHALSEGRVDNTAFAQAIYTNLTHDHLDYHLTMENYATAKAKLFARPELKTAILNQDDEFSSFMQKDISTNCDVITYGMTRRSAIWCQKFTPTADGTEINLVTPWGKFDLVTALPGKFNIYNIMAIFASLISQGVKHGDVVDVIGKLPPVPGRMEILHNKPMVVVDYAHTPDALQNILQSLQAIKQQRLILVFGCGGARDREKRAPMGKIAAQYADIVIVTSDNPRTESPDAIIADIMAGMSDTTSTITITERAVAITEALKLAGSNDIVLVAGKGHENYQEIDNIRLPYCDQEVIQQYLSLPL